MSGDTAYQIVYDLSKPTAPVGRIAVIDPDGDATYQSVSGFPSTLLVHPDGSVYYSTTDFTGDESKVWILGQTDPVLIMGGTPLQVPVLPPGGAIYVPTWAPNVSKSYIAVMRPGQDTVVEEFDGLAYPDRPMVLTPTAAMSPGCSWLTRRVHRQRLCSMECFPPAARRLLEPGTFTKLLAPNGRARTR